LDQKSGRERGEAHHTEQQRERERCRWGSTTATTARSSSRTRPPPGSVTSRAPSTSARAPPGTTPSATKVRQNLPRCQLVACLCSAFRRTPPRLPLRWPDSFSLSYSTDRHGGAPSLLLPDGTLAKGVCHHFVRTVRASPPCSVGLLLVYAFKFPDEPRALVSSYHQ
jgi:hypothetical protein